MVGAKKVGTEHDGPVPFHLAPFIFDLTTNEIEDQKYGQTPDYEMISRIALDRNPHFGTTYRFFESDAVGAVLVRAPFMIILKSGATVAIISSLVGLPTALLMEYINTLYPDRDRYQRAFNTYKVALEILFNHERELSAIRQDRRRR